VKLDADLILPDNYFETIIDHFHSDKTGMVGGFAYIEKKMRWILENRITRLIFVGAFKAYRKETFSNGRIKTYRNGWDL
jgi:hypothetical protein